MKGIYVYNGKFYRYAHHEDLRMPEDVEFIIPEELSGCREQVFRSSDLKRVVRFRSEIFEINTETHNVRIWSAAYPKNFFKLSMRLSKPYVYNLEEIMSRMVSNVLRAPLNMCRGSRYCDISGKISEHQVKGMASFTPKVSRLTQEVDEIIGTEKDKIPLRVRSFDYWVYDKESIDGVVLTVGNENGHEFIRFHELDGSIMTAYVRPWFGVEFEV